MGKEAQPSLAEESLVDAAQLASEGGIDGHAQRYRLPVHRPSRRDDEVGQRDQALAIHRPIGDEERGQSERAYESPLLGRAGKDDGVDVSPPAEHLEQAQEERVWPAVVEGDVGGRAENDHDAVSVDAELVEHERIGSEVGQVVLLLEAGIADELGRAKPVAAQPLLGDRLWHHHPRGRASAELVLEPGELVVEGGGAWDAETAGDQGEVVGAVGQGQVRPALASETAEGWQAGCHGLGLGRRRAAPVATDYGGLDPVQLKELHGLGVLTGGHVYLVALLAEEANEGPKDEDVGRVREVDPDAHGRWPLYKRLFPRPGRRLCDERWRRPKRPRRRLGGYAERIVDTRQLAAFCAVVERRSFSQAAAFLGVTPPAVSQQGRALERRLGTTLLDRSGRRVEPTEAGLRLYRGAQRLLGLEEELLAELAREEGGKLRGRLEIGASTGPAAVAMPLLLGAFQRRYPDVEVALSVFPTQTVVELVAERRLELGVVGAARRHRSVVFEPFFRDEVILVCPPGHPFAGRTVALDELARGPLVLMQPGAGVRQMLEDELRRSGRKLSDLGGELQLGLQESVRSAVQAGYGVTFISRRAVEADLASGTLAEARVEGLDLERQIWIARARGRAASRAAEAFLSFARERLEQ